MYGCLSLVFPRPLSVCFLFPTSGIHISSNTMIYYDATSPISFYISRNEINNFTHVHVYLFSPIMQQPGSIVPLVMFYLLQTFSTFASTNIILLHFDHHLGVDVSASHHLAELLKADLSVIVLVVEKDRLVHNLLKLALFQIVAHHHLQHLEQLPV